VRAGPGEHCARDDVERTISGADAVYTSAPTLAPGGDGADPLHALDAYRVDDRTMAAAGAHAVFLHSLPAHRGEEVAGAVLDGRQSVVFDQAENRMHAEMAVLVALLNGSIVGMGEIAPGTHSLAGNAS
jgi:ornithine carbamoyltransferase